MSLFNINLHIHSNLSGCASKDMYVNNIIKAAKGFKTIGIVDHVDNPKRREKRSKQILKHNRFSKRIIQQDKVKILFGCETTQINETSFSVTDEVAEKLDLVLVSSNHYHLKYVDRPQSETKYAEHHLNMLIGAINWEYTDILAHPFHLHKLKNIDHKAIMRSYDRNKLKDVLWLAKENNKVFELCPRHFSQQLDFFQELLSYCRDISLKFSISTDAHKPHHIPYSKKDINNFKLLGLRKEDIINNIKGVQINGT